MIYFKENVNKTTLYTSKDCNIPCIDENIMFKDNLREYKVVGIISIAGSANKTVIVQPLSTSYVSYKDYLGQ